MIFVRPKTGPVSYFQLRSLSWRERDEIAANIGPLPEAKKFNRRHKHDTLDAPVKTKKTREHVRKVDPTDWED